MPDIVRVVLCCLVSTVSTIFGVFALSYAVNIVHIPRTTTLCVAILTNVVALVAIPLWAKLSDRIGRKPVFIVRTPVPSVGMAFRPRSGSRSRASRRRSPLRCSAQDPLPGFPSPSHYLGL
jgi:MFS family permease